MKKMIVMFLALTVMAAGLFAAETVRPAVSQVTVQKAETAKTVPETAWEFLSIAFFPGFTTSPDFINVYGLRLGVPIGFGEFSSVTGVEGSMLVSMTRHVYGVQAAPLFNSAQRVEGLQASTLVNYASNEVLGLQLGLINIAGTKSCQIGLVNIIHDSWLPFTILFNIRF